MYLYNTRSRIAKSLTKLENKKTKLEKSGISIETSYFRNPSRTSKSRGPLSPFLLRSYPFLLLKSFNSDFHESFCCKYLQQNVNHHLLNKLNTKYKAIYFTQLLSSPINSLISWVHRST